MFTLDPRLAADCWPMGDWPLCHVLLMNEARYPWCILVPRRAATSEVFELSTPDQARLWQEASALAAALKSAFAADKINIAALGNQVAQLHVHVIARQRGDAAWPAPVWGRFTPKPYLPSQVDAVRARLLQALGAGAFIPAPLHI